MATEIERKFLVNGSGWRKSVIRTAILADYLIASFQLGKFRIRRCNETYSLTLKGLKSGRSRSEYLLDVGSADAEEMISEFAIGPPIEKIRHEVEFAGLIWQIDDFGGALAGLVTVDVELPSEEADPPLPPWVGKEITECKRYSSARLARLLAEGSAHEV